MHKNTCTVCEYDLITDIRDYKNGKTVGKLRQLVCNYSLQCSVGISLRFIFFHCPLPYRSTIKKCMGGVDLVDRAISNVCSCIYGKKWYSPPSLACHQHLCGSIMENISIFLWPDDHTDVLVFFQRSRFFPG